VLVYAGGIMVLFLFVVMLINVRNIEFEPMLSPYWKGGLGLGLGLFLLLAGMVRTGNYHPPIVQPENLSTVTDITRTRDANGQIVVTETKRANANSEVVGMALYQEYLVPFELASLFLLVAMIGAIVIGKRDLAAEEEEAVPQFIRERAEEEERMKEAAGA
jgi:NADH:ubiquinone oxidoreductase subunit 6 (subunit J)